MRALRPMTKEEREFAEQHHDMVIDYLRYKRLPMDDFYDIVIFVSVKSLCIKKPAARSRPGNGEKQLWFARNGSVPGQQGPHNIRLSQLHLWCRGQEPSQVAIRI